MSHDVFISHSHKDKAIADAICTNLETAGVRCWIAPRDIEPGVDWPSAISNAIPTSRIMVLIFSASSNTSTQVYRELFLAAGNNVIIIPFKIEDVEPEPRKGYILAGTHWLDAMNPPTQEQIDKLIETVRKVLTPESPAAVPVTPAPLPTAPKKARPPKTKIFKPWMLWVTLPVIIMLIMAICVAGVYFGKKLLPAKPNSQTPTWTRTAPALTQPFAQPFTPAPGSTVTVGPIPTAAVSVNVHATAGTILEVPGSYVAWSPDGKWLVIGERQIHYYDPHSLTEVRSFQADRWVNGMVISPDSKVLAAIDETRGVMLFDMATGSELRTLPRTDISTSAASSSFLAFTPDSLTLAVVLGDTVKLFDVATGQETGTIVAKGAMTILFSNDGQSLYAGGWEGITVWNVSTGAKILSMGDMTNEGSRMVLSPDGSLLVTAGSFDQPMVLWEAVTGRQLRTFAGHTGGVNSLAFSPDGKLLASSAGDVTIKLWDVATGNALQTLVGHTEAASSLAFSPDGATLVSGSGDGTTRLWNLSEGISEPTVTPTPPSSTASSLPTALPLSAQAISVDNATQVKNQRILDVEGSLLTWSPDGKWLVIGGTQGHIYDAQNMSQVRTIPVKYDVGGLAISPDSKVLAVIDISNAVKLFDMATGSELRTLPRTDISTSATSNSFLAFTPDSTTLAVVLGDTVKLYNVASGQETGTIVAKGAMTILFSPDGQSLYAGGWEGITVWNVSTGAKILSMGDMTNEGSRMALSPDGNLLVTGGVFNQPMVLWEAATGRQLRSFSGHTGGINSLAFSPDGKLLASAAGDVTIKLWDVATGNALQTLVGHTQAASSLAFSPDGATLVSTAYDQGVWLWGVSAK